VGVQAEEGKFAAEMSRLNDATGLICLRFAVVFLLTGSF